MNQVEIAVIGAGIAGLVCAQVLQQAGYQVVVLDKSRGVGGRVATRRLHGTIADHGTCYLSPKGELFQALTNRLIDLDIVQAWTDRVYGLEVDCILQPPAPEEVYPRYVAPDGMTVIAKFLATGLDIRFSQRVLGLQLTGSQTGSQSWQLTLENATPESTGDSVLSTLAAQTVIVAIPAPQAVMLLQPLGEGVLSTEFLHQLQSVEFAPCISVMAGYLADCLPEWLTQYPEVTAIAPAYHPDLAWIGLDSSKRRSSSQPVFVIQSTAQFAKEVLESADLIPSGHRLLQQAGRLLAPWLATPEWLQVHRWRYAFATRPLQQRYLSADTPIPLICSGDWCGGTRAESALLSGLEAASYLDRQLQNRQVAIPHVWDAILQQVNLAKLSKTTRTP